MGRRLYVGNLAYSVDSSELQQMFGAHGTVTSAEVISDRVTGRSKGFGFVEMGSDDEAQAAIAALKRAAKPIIVAGGGAAASGAGAEIIKLAETLSIPIATSLHSKAIVPDAHPLNVGGSVGIQLRKGVPRHARCIGLRAVRRGSERGLCIPVRLRLEVVPLAL